MDTSTPPMHLCRRWARESYCTADLMTRFSRLFFFPPLQCTHQHGACLFSLRGRGTIECDSWIPYFLMRSWTMPISRPFPDPMRNYVVRPRRAYSAINSMNENADLYKCKKFIKITFWVYSNNKVEYNCLSMHWLQLRMNKSNTGMIRLLNEQTKLHQNDA